jgi:hypothetical protein
LVAVIGAAVGVALAYHRHPVYSSTAIVSSARLDALAEALPGYVEASTSLASTYSRIAITDAVEAPVAKRLGLPLATVQQRISATPVPGDPVLTIVGRGPTAAAARRVVAATAASLAHYISGLVSSSSQQAGALSQYTATTAAMEALSVRIARLQLAGSSATLRSAQLEQSRLSLRLKGLSSSYVNQALNATSGAGPQILTAAGPASSDRGSKAEDYGAVGLLAALIVGLAIERLAWARARARRSAMLQAV